MVAFTERTVAPSPLAPRPSQFLRIWLQRGEMPAFFNSQLCILRFVIDSKEKMSCVSCS